jgi:tetratricopeptide (TPR) repeat protein
MTFRLFALLSGAALITLSSCDLKKMIKKAKEQKVVVTPSPLELHGDSVRFTFSGELPTKMLKKGKIYTINLAYKYRDEKLPVGEIKFSDKDFPNHKKESPKVSKRFAFAYKGTDMDLGELTLVGVASNLNNRAKATPEMTMAKGLVLTNQLVQDAYFTAITPHGYNADPEYTPLKVNFYFDQGSPKMRAKEIKGATGKRLDAYIAGKNATKTVTITGMHSPEGREVKNTQLSELRAKAIEKYYRDQMKRFNYGKRADSIEFITKSLVQSWKPFIDSLSLNPNISADERAKIIEIVNGPGSFVEQELELQKLPCYKTLFLEVYPKLRLGQTEILTLKPKKSDSQILSFAKILAEGGTPAESLNDLELAYAATLTPLLDEKEAIFLAATKQNDNWSSHNNLGAVRLEMAKKASANQRMALVDKALINLEISKNKRESGEVYANLATAYLMKGDHAKAMDAITKGQGMTTSAEAKRIMNTVKGIIEIKRGNYPSAISALNNGVDDATVAFDKGLAQLLNKDYNAAVNSFEEAINANGNVALFYYCSGVAYARQNKESDMVRQLKKAFTMDANLKKRALSDLEFDNFAGKAAFTDLLR